MTAAVATYGYAVWPFEPEATNAEIQSTLNERGADGWRLVTVVPAGDHLVAFFEHPAQRPPVP